jgi:hypothetical protein
MLAQYTQYFNAQIPGVHSHGKTLTCKSEKIILSSIAAIRALHYLYKLLLSMIIKKKTNATLNSLINNVFVHCAANLRFPLFDESAPTFLYSRRGQLGIRPRRPPRPRGARSKEKKGGGGGPEAVSQ